MASGTPLTGVALNGEPLQINTDWFGISGVGFRVTVVVEIKGGQLYASVTETVYTPPTVGEILGIVGFAKGEVNPFGPVHVYTIGGFPPDVVDVNWSVLLLQIGELLLAVTVNGMLASVPNEISSSPKSLPFKLGSRLIIRMVAVVALPEFHIP